MQFSIQLKSGTTKQALAIVVAYNKQFETSRFVYSSGLKVPRKGFNAAKPGKDLKRLLDTVQKAHDSIIADGSPLNTDSLKARIKLFIERTQWLGNELHVYNGNSLERYVLNDGVDKPELEKLINTELLKAHPNTKKVIDNVLTHGSSQLFGFWQSIIDGETKPRAGKTLKPSSVSVKRQALRTVKEFNPNASFEKMDMQFYNGLTLWMSKQTVRKEKKIKKEKPDGKFEIVESFEILKRFDVNTVGKVVKELKSVLHLAYRNELLNNDRFRYWPVTKQSNHVVALSKEEVLKINNLELSGTKQDVRDIFILACFLGPRISDFKSFKRQNLFIEGGITFFEYRQEKTGDPVRVPVHPIAMQILEKRQGEFPKMIAEQNFRSYLKEICKQAKLNDQVYFKAGKDRIEKHKAISPHSARRTFASALFYGWFGKPMPAALAMRYTGHRSEKSFMLYIGATDKDLDTKALEYFDFQPQMKVS